MTTVRNTNASAEPIWYTVDAEGEVLGRLASRVASLLRGKHRPSFAPHREGGDHVIVLNAAKVRLTGRKVEQKVHRYHTGYPGGLKEVGYADLLRQHPERVIEYAVWGMLPKNRLGRKLRRNLRVYAGREHPHEAQRPEPLELRTRAGHAIQPRTENA
jgi:large subunit ribosomal protein L13